MGAEKRERKRGSEILGTLRREGKGRDREREREKGEGRKGGGGGGRERLNSL